MAISPPLVALAVVAPVQYKPWLVSAVVVGVAVLLGQAASQTRAANGVLANSAYLEYITLPILESVTKELERYRLHRDAGDGEWCGAIVKALYRTGSKDIGSLALMRTLSESSEGQLLDQLVYFRANDKALYEQVKRMVLHPANQDNPRFRHVLAALERLGRWLYTDLRQEGAEQEKGTVQGDDSTDRNLPQRGPR